MQPIDKEIHEELLGLRKEGLMLLIPFGEYQAAQEKGHSAKRPSLDSTKYEAWYTKALAAVRQLAPDRLADFTGHYKLPKPAKELDLASYRLSDAIVGIVIVGTREEFLMNTVIQHLSAQINIVASLFRGWSQS